MSPSVDRVAKAIHEAERGWASTPGPAWADCHEVTREMRRVTARAAADASLAEMCEFLRSATRWEPGSGRDRHINGWRAAADELERHFGSPSAVSGQEGGEDR